METSLAGLVSFLTMKNRLEMAFQGGGRGAATTRRALYTTPIARGDYSPGIIYHPYCPRRLLAGHYVPPQLPAATARQALYPPLLPAATARRALCTTPIARGDCSTSIVPTPFTCGDCSPGFFPSL